MAGGDRRAKQYLFTVSLCNVVLFFHQDSCTSSLPLPALPGVTPSSEDHPGKLLAPRTCHTVQRYPWHPLPLLLAAKLCPLDWQEVFWFFICSFLKYGLWNLRFGIHFTMSLFKPSESRFKPLYLQVIIHQVWCSSACFIAGLAGRGTQLFQWRACDVLNRRVATAVHGITNGREISQAFLWFFRCTDTRRCLTVKFKSYTS